jgi:tetratricopeptide (TPR) repeat protein
MVAHALWTAGRFAEAATLQRRNLEDARAVAEPEQHAYILCGLGSALWPQGDLDAAEAYLLDALSLAERLSDRFLLLSTEYHLANLWAERAFLVREDEGQREIARQEAVTRFRRVVALAQAQRSDQMMFYSTVDLASALIEWGRVEQARPLVDLALYTLAQLEDCPGAQAWMLLCRAELARAEGGMRAAASYAEQATPVLEASSPIGLARAHRVAAQACCALGQADATAAHARAALSAAERHSQSVERLRTEAAIRVAQS